MNANRERHAYIPDSEKTRLERVLGALVKMQWWIALGLFLVWGTNYYQQPIEQPTALMEKLTVLRKQNADLQALRDQQERRVEWLRTQPDYLAIEARDHLNVKQGSETILRIEK
jgi:cell division protein FtsB